MKKIVVGVDLSAESEQAVAHAVGLARRDGATITLVMADCVPEFPSSVSSASREVAVSYLEELERRLSADRTQLGKLRERWTSGSLELSQIVVDGYADEAVPNVALEIGADLIVVGSRGRTGVKRWVLGSVAERVVRHAEQSVLVARGDAPSGGYARVVIGTDFSPLAEAAIARALPILAPHARIDLVHCWQVPWAGMPAVAMPFAEIRADLEKGLNAAADQVRTSLRALGRPEPAEVHVHLLNGSASHCLITVAADQQADLVVTGSHGYRGVRRFVLGSVAEVTVRHAPCSVLVGR